MQDEDGIITERKVLVNEIRADLERLSETVDTAQAVTDDIRATIAMVADKMDALSDLIR